MQRIRIKLIPANVYVFELLLIFIGGYFTGKYVEAKDRQLDEEIKDAIKDAM